MSELGLDEHLSPFDPLILWIDGAGVAASQPVSSELFGENSLVSVEIVVHRSAVIIVIYILFMCLNLGLKIETLNRSLIKIHKGRCTMTSALRGRVQSPKIWFVHGLVKFVPAR